MGVIMSESPVGLSAQSTNPIDSSGPSRPSQRTSSPLQSPSPLDNHTSGNESDKVEILLDKVSDGNDDDDGKRLRSLYWAHYNVVKIQGVYKAICKYCAVKICGETKNETSHLSQHYIRKHQKKDTMRLQVLTNNFIAKDRPPLLTSYNFDHGTTQTELANAIIMHEHSLSIVDHVGFKRYSNALQSLFKVLCRNTMKAEIFKIYECQRGKTMSMVVSNASTLAITTDMWTSNNQKKGFMAVTSHFIDDS
ncbi:zinc finger BED domain-containing protein RICESLEEPER 2-like [Rhododendron vialii]|uniref:zinc finger BED domain-containing protein RICESLEEPER 2-like n=1 Tax=Rhododendron vialii TaxID=182163 RepID=UPI00265D99DC|nr:zinc finger BED domain-containing protein RICESLEEPER 2-like [Rhododendron vialii]